ncbi:MAG: acetate kinase, partial [Prevotellaceae bacterium]|nr:acetate kinase [Prevotellaceae bacterium]
MKILVINCGSSSIKYKLYEMDDRSVLAAGGIERVGLPGAFLKTTVNGEKVTLDFD